MPPKKRKNRAAINAMGAFKKAYETALPPGLQGAVGQYARATGLVKTRGRKGKNKIRVLDIKKKK